MVSVCRREIVSCPSHIVDETLYSIYRFCFGNLSYFCLSYNILFRFAIRSIKLDIKSTTFILLYEKPVPFIISIEGY